MNINIPTFNGKPYIYIACNHDRHTDDVYEAFLDEGKAKQRCRDWMVHWKDLEENRQYGDWCLYISDDYHAFIQKVELKTRS